jgi:hypothetical protein
MYANFIDEVKEAVLKIGTCEFYRPKGPSDFPKTRDQIIDLITEVHIKIVCKQAIAAMEKLKRNSRANKPNLENISPNIYQSL